MTEALLFTLLAFTAPQDFKAPVELGGASGARFTGSPSSKWDCGVCHDPQAGLELVVRSTPDTLFDKGYEPNQLYELEVTVSKQSLTSAFGMEVVSRSGQFAGTFANVPGQKQCSDMRDAVEIQGTGEAAQSVACAPNLTRWKLTWTAPGSDIGTVTLYAAAVVGDKDGSNTGDLSAARVLGIPSPTTLAQRSSGCGAPAAALLIPFAAIFLRRRRSPLLLLMVMLPALADARPRPKPKKPAPTAPVSEAVPPAEVVDPAEVAAPVPAVAPVAPPAVPQTPEQTVAIEPPDSFGPSVHVDVSTGFGFRSLALYSNSFATPLRVQLGFPVVGVAIGFRPMRLLRFHVLEGIEVEGQYQRGWVIGQQPAVPSDGKLAIGYSLELGPITIYPRFVFRVLVGGVEKNFLFDDAWYQGVGGELALAVAIGRLTIFARPQVAKVIDTGTLTEANYGKAKGGLSLGGDAGVSFQFGESGFVLGIAYRITHTTAAWAGGGLRSLGPIASVDQTHLGELSLRYSR